MNSKDSYFSHVSTCNKCLPFIEQGRVCMTCFDGWQLYLEAQRENDYLTDLKYGKDTGISLHQVWLDNLRQRYVEWLAGPDPNEINF